MLRTFLSCASFAAIAGVVLSGRAQDAPVRVQADTSQTAVWLGDAFEYRVTLVHRRGVEIIRENLTAENLDLEPFVLLGLTIQSRPAADETDILDLRLSLMLLNATEPEAVIPPLTIYYATRRPGPLGKGSEIETQTLVVPEKTVGVASSLTRDSDDIRDAVATPESSAAGRVIWLLGWGVVGVVFLQSGYWLVSHYRQTARVPAARDRRLVARQALERLDRLAAASSRDDELRGQCTEIVRIVQDALAQIAGIEVANFTPNELKEELFGAGAAEPLADKVRQVVQDCEAVRYRRPTDADGRTNVEELIRSSRAVVSELAER